MEPPEKASSTFIKPGPYGARIPSALAGIGAGLIVLVRSPGHITETDAIGIIAAMLVVFFSPKHRPFWFFAGIVVAVLLIQALPQLHSFFAR
jgi:hypothetical protein